MHKPLFYEAPDAKVLVLRYEEAFLQGSGPVPDPGAAGEQNEYDNQGNYTMGNDLFGEG